MNFDEAKQFVQKRFLMIDEKLLYNALIYSDEDEVGFEKDGEQYHLYNALKKEIGASWFEFGCSKIVFGFRELEGYVVKLPLFGQWTEKYNKETDDFDIIFDEYKNASSENEPNDYCRKESEVYELLQKDGLANLAFGTYFLFSADGVSVYMSEICENCGLTTSKCFPSVSEESQKKGHQKSMDSGYIMYDDMISVFIEQYGEIITDKLLEFISKYGIRDFHNGNVGYDSTGRIRMIDYSGFDC